MNFEIALIGLSIYILFWEKLPEWGTWFNWLLAKLPAPLIKLYEDWRCPYCSGFWIALVLKALTGIETLPSLAVMPEYLGFFSIYLAWFLDALAAAVLILFGRQIILVITAPAFAGHKAKMGFLKEMKEKQAQSNE